MNERRKFSAFSQSIGRNLQPIYETYVPHLMQCEDVNHRSKAFHKSSQAIFKIKIWFVCEILKLFKRSLEGRSFADVVHLHATAHKGSGCCHGVEILRFFKISFFGLKFNLIFKKEIYFCKSFGQRCNKNKINLATAWQMNANTLPKTHSK
jgi:hypothetical protein